MPERHVDAFARRGRQRDADDRRAHRIRLAHPDVDRRASPSRARPRRTRASSSLRVIVRNSRFGGGGAGSCCEQARELELGEEAPQLGLVGAAVRRCSGSHAMFASRLQRDELLREARVGLVVREGLAELRALDLVEVRVDAVERAELGQADRPPSSARRSARRARCRTCRPMSARQIAELARAHAELLAHLGRPVDLVAHRVPQHDVLVVVVDELHQVLVGADDDDAALLLRRRASTSAAMRSSASSPASSKMGMLYARTICSQRTICWPRSGGGGGRVAL